MVETAAPSKTAPGRCGASVTVTPELWAFTCRGIVGHEGPHEFAGVAWDGTHYTLTWTEAAHG